MDDQQIRLVRVSPTGKEWSHAESVDERRPIPGPEIDWSAIDTALRQARHLLTLAEVAIETRNPYNTKRYVMELTERVGDLRLHAVANYERFIP